MKLSVLGGGCEVGRLSVLLDAGKDRFLFDCGINVQTNEKPLLENVHMSCVVLSHAHLDHSGYIPALYSRGYDRSVYATSTTHELSEMILKDSLKVQRLNGLHPDFSEYDIMKYMRKSKNLPYGECVDFNDMALSLHDAGHTPGSAMALLEGRKNILFTGDINLIKTNTTKPACSTFSDIDTLIIEGTYAYKNHPDRPSVESRLREKVENVVSNGGIVLLPTFAVGRAQEILSIIQDLEVPIYFDGMGVGATRIILEHKDSVKDYRKLQSGFRKAVKIRKPRQRGNLLDSPCVVITTAGMLNGGPINFYIKHLHERTDCTLLMTGYQVEGTVGRVLMETGRYVNEGLDIKPKMDVDFMDFSSHAGRDDLLNFIKTVNPEKVVVVHSDHGVEFSKELKSMGFMAYAPKSGETINI